MKYIYFLAFLYLKLRKCVVHQMMRSNFYFFFFLILLFAAVPWKKYIDSSDKNSWNSHTKLGGGGIKTKENATGGIKVIITQQLNSVFLTKSLSLLGHWPECIAFVFNAISSITHDIKLTIGEILLFLFYKRIYSYLAPILGTYFITFFTVLRQICGYW